MSNSSGRKDGVTHQVQQGADDDNLDQPQHSYDNMCVNKHIARFHQVLFSDLSAESDNDTPPNPEQMFSSTVSIRGFQKFLTSHHVGGTAIACKLLPYEHRNLHLRQGICEGHCVIAYVYIGESGERRLVSDGQGKLMRPVVY